MKITHNSYDNGVIILLFQFKPPNSRTIGPCKRIASIKSTDIWIFFGISNVAKSCDTRHKSEFYLMERIFFLSSGLIQ